MTERISNWPTLRHVCREGATGTWTRGLLIRRRPADGSCVPFTTWRPARITIERLVVVEVQLCTIEDAFETTKTELGHDHNRNRSLRCWHHHVSLTPLAFTMPTVIPLSQCAAAKALIRLTRTRQPHPFVAQEIGGRYSPRTTTHLAIPRRCLVTLASGPS
jgi:hypothetical protein